MVISHDIVKDLKLKIKAMYIMLVMSKNVVPFFYCISLCENQLSNENQRSAMNGGDVYWEESQNKNSQWDGI